MSDWDECECETFFSDDRSVASEPCRVRIGEGQIAIIADNPTSAWRYEGIEDGPGHFRLWSKTHTGEGTLHRFEHGDILEGSWEEEMGGNQDRGMWRITLGRSEGA